MWGLIEVYSNADRSIQFVVHSTHESGQQHIGGLTLVASGEGTTRTFTFASDLPGDSAGRRFLVATQGFADLSVLWPDFIVPNGFFPVSGGVIWVAGHAYEYPSVPTDGVEAFWQEPDVFSYYANAVATNFAGGHYVFGPPSPSATPTPPPPTSPRPTRPPATAPPVVLIEYIDATFGHYFITSNSDEITKLDNGTIAGWTRTGFQFNAYAVAPAGESPVCRFYSTAFAPKFPHFFTPFPAECKVVASNPNWLLESAAAFYAALPAVDGSCAAGSSPVYRLYNNGQGAAPNHRYTTDLHVRAQMIAQGWVPEGIGPDAVEMCSPQ